MKYLKHIKVFKEELTTDNKSDELLIENVNYHKTHIKNLGEVKLPDPEFGDLKLSVMPFENNGEYVNLPDGFKLWEESFNNILKMIPLQEGANQHYVTIDTKFFTTDEFLRREGIHMDGNFCVDPNFVTLNEGYSLKKEQEDVPIHNRNKMRVVHKASWGGAEPKPSWGGAEYIESDEDFKASWGGAEPKPSWGGARYEAKEDNSHVKMDWVLPYKLTIPVADYVSEKKGGILTVSTEIGCQAWDGEFYGEILGEGSFANMENQLKDDNKKIFEKDQLYFMTSNTPHETLLITKGKRRTFLRITLNHNYQNEAILNIK